MLNNKSTPTNFVATVYGNLTPLNNSAFSKARLKIFYKGLNRNGSYITEEIAEKLIASLPGTPVVGNFQGEKDDFEGHSPWAPEELKAYGFVPETMNFNWEMNLDPDGVYRTYACTDIILWTGRYPIASRIVGKSHSMELNPNTIEGEWVEQDDEFYYQFTNAEFFGLCVLGEEYEPCFEGSSFYELNNKADKKAEFSKELVEMFSLYNTLDGVDKKSTGGQEMEEENKDALESTITPEEEQEKKVPANNELEDGAAEAKPEEEVEEGAASEEQSEEESEEEETEGSEEPEEESDEESDEEEGEEEDEESEEEESEEEPEVDLNAELAKKDEEIANLKEELEGLKSYKAQKIKEEKEAVLNSYSNKLTEEEIESFKSKMDSYDSAVELKKDIAICILDKESNEELEDETTQYSLVNNHKDSLTGAAAIVAQYVKK